MSSRTVNKQDCDFHGWVTMNDLLCDDGVVIRQGAFAHDDGMVVPLVWNHQYSGPDNVLGKVLLENRKKGVYGYGFLNNTSKAKDARIGLQHGDITAMSIAANKIRHKGVDVVQGKIREVSLVLAGANPGATIEYVLQHGDIEDYTSAVIYTGEDVLLSHSAEDFEDEEDAKKEVEDEDADEGESETETEEDSEPSEEGESEDSGDGAIEHSSGKTVADVIATFTEEQQDVLLGLLASVIDDDSIKEDENLKQSVFANQNTEMGNDLVLEHSALRFEKGIEKEVDAQELMHAILSGAKRYGSLKESYLQHAAGDYGIKDIDWLFPQEKTLNNPPEFIKRDTSWVAGVMSGVHKTPFSRIRSVFADLTEDEARAKGYIKGHMKKEEFFTLVRRSTTPTTVYKKQKFDRDDLVDITDFDMVAWIKLEMRMMLDEELATSYLVGDGRPSSSEDKINESNIRPIWTDDDLFTIKVPIDLSTATTDTAKGKAIIKSVIRARKNYKGSGTPTFYTTEDVLTDMLLIEDNNGRFIYETPEQLARQLRVSKIVTIPTFENRTRPGRATVDAEKNKNFELIGLIVNLTDYNVGADKGGAVAMFDDFDIDYNQQKYLIETRCSGALTKPYSAMAIEAVTTTSSGSGGSGGSGDAQG